MSDSMEQDEGNSNGLNGLNGHSTKDLKQLRLDGEELLNEYKAHALDILENEAIKEKRERMLADCEHLLLTELSSSNKTNLDFIWKYCFYEVISAFKSQRKRFKLEELDSLQSFLHNGINYFESLSERIPCTTYRCLLFKGDLLRYEHKMIKTDDAVLKMAELCYKKAFKLEPQTATTYTKLACVYESSPHIALNFLLRAIVNKTSSAISTMQKLKNKTLPSQFADVFALAQSAFDGSDFQEKLNAFKEFMDKYTTFSANIIMQNIHTICLLSIAIEGNEEKSDDKLKLLIPTIAQYLNIFVPLLLEQLSKNSLLQERRNCPSPFEEDEDELSEDYLTMECEPTLYENVLFPVIPLLLTVNEWVGNLSRWMSSLKLSVGARMACQSVFLNFAELLNTFIDIFGYRVQNKTNEWPRAINWMSANSASLKKSEAFGILIDSLKQSIATAEHPLDFQDTFKCNLSPKEKRERSTSSLLNGYTQPNCLVVSLDSWLLHWWKIVFLLDQIEELTVLMSAATHEQLNQKSAIRSDYRQCLKHIHRFEETKRCLIYEDSVGSASNVVEMLNQTGDVREIVLVVEQSETVKEQLPRDVQCCSANDLYTRYCQSIKLNLTDTYLPFMVDSFQPT
ncbi:hypothetical protein M3Y97_00396300 [Aphelenchoides bicaudatus]|nr:hypothetical protein M3Y97_00396300 [Aphelenchoides bicaudatus]